MVADPFRRPDFISRKARTLPFSFNPPRKRIIWRVVKRPDLIVVETRLVYFQRRASLLRARHVIDREAERLGGRFETPITKSVVSAIALPAYSPAPSVESNQIKSFCSGFGMRGDLLPARCRGFRARSLEARAYAAASSFEASGAFRHLILLRRRARERAVPRIV